MRILHIIASANPIGGGPIEGLKQLGAAMTRKGHKIEVATLDDPKEEFVSQFPLTVHALGPGKSALGYTPNLVPWLKNNRERFDAVVINGLWMYNSIGGRKGLLGSKIPYFVFTHGMLDPWFNTEYPLKRLKKILFWRFWQYPVLRDARYVLFTSEEEKILARQSFRPYEVREKVVKYGTPGPAGDLEELKDRFLSRFPEYQGKRLIIYLSRIHAKKGCDMLIKAFAKVQNQDKSLHLVIAGPDKTNWVPELKDLATNAGILDRISFPGMLSGDDKWGAYAASEAFILPSHQENFGIVVAEALSCSLPVLISNKVNIWREIDSYGAGFVAADDDEGTLELLTKWISLNADQKSAMRNCAKNCFLDNFEINAAADFLLDIERDGRPIN